MQEQLAVTLNSVRTTEQKARLAAITQVEKRVASALPVSSCGETTEVNITQHSSL
jgi:hypothetical protein